MATDGHVLILADGSAPSPGALDRVWPGWSDGIDTVIAADGGARNAEVLGQRIDLWVGDGDSIGERALSVLEADGVPVRRSPAAKDETDTELALLAALEREPGRITIVGALGGERFDHALANVWLLDHPGLAGRSACLLDDAVRVRLIGSGRTELGGRIGDLVSLLPFGGDATGITTHGLRYALRDEPLLSGPSRGLSNVRDAADAAVEVGGGRVLVLETPATL